MSANDKFRIGLLNASMLGSKIWALTWDRDVTLAGKYKKFLSDNSYDINALSASNPREIAGRSLLERGRASIDEIMAATHGEWPVKGLDIVGDNPRSVKFESFPVRDILSIFSPDPTKRVIGQAAPSGEAIRMNTFRTVFLPGLSGESGTNSFLGHEATHSLQVLHHEQSHKMFGSDIAETIKNDPDNLQSGKVAEELFGKHTDSNKLGDIQKNLHLQYLRDGHEIQARITQMLAEGYQHWKIMPRNREELAVAMIDIGIKAPADVVQALDESPTIEKAREVFSSDAFKWFAQSIDINHALDTLTPEGKTQFWNDTLPKLYSDLIEMQGDGPGRARFGLGQNPWPERRRQAGLTVRDELDQQSVPTAATKDKAPAYTASYGFEELTTKNDTQSKPSKTPRPAQPTVS